MKNIYLWWFGLSIIMLFGEAFTFTSVFLVLGFAAAITGIIVAFIPDMDVAYQLFLFSILGAIGYPVIKGILKKRGYGKDTTGDIDTSLKNSPSGVVKELDAPGRSGTVRFNQQFLGDKQWKFISSEPLDINDSVSVINIEGNTLLVKKE